MKKPKDKEADSLARYADKRGDPNAARGVARTTGLTWKAVRKRLKKLQRVKARYRAVK